MDKFHALLTDKIDQRTQNPPGFNLVLVGGDATGKTSFVRRHVTGEFWEKGNSVQVQSIAFITDGGQIVFNVWDLAGQVAHNLDAHCAIIMFDVTSRKSYTHVEQSYQNIIKAYEHIPIVLVGNKTDVKERKVVADAVTFHRKKGLDYCEVSAKSGHNCGEPFLQLARKVMDNDLLEFVTICGAPRQPE